MSNNPLTIEDLKARYHIGNSKAYALCETRGFPAFRIGEGGRWLIDPSKLEVWEAKISNTSSKTWEFSCITQFTGTNHYSIEELLEILKLLEADYD